MCDAEWPPGIVNHPDCVARLRGAPVKDITRKDPNVPRVDAIGCLAIHANRGQPGHGLI